MNENAREISGAEAPEETKKPIYTCESTLDEILFSEFSEVSYSKVKNFNIIFTVINILYCLVNLIYGNYDTTAGYSVFFTILMYVMYFNIKNVAKINFQRTMLSYGSEHRQITELYEDKILSSFGKNKREFFYFQINGLFETDNLILMRLQYNLYLELNKIALNADPQVVKAFLIQKCPMVKKKKFTDCSNSRRLSFIFLLISTAYTISVSLICILFTFSGI